MSTTTGIRPDGLAWTGADDGVPSLARLTRVELRKSADTRAGFWLLSVIAVATLAVVVLQMVFADAADRTFAGYFTTSQLPVGVLLPVLGILLVTSEWSQRTVGTTFALVPVRSRVLAAKVLAATVLGGLGVVAAATASAVATALTPVFTDDGARWQLTGAHLGQVLVVQVLTVLVGIAFGMLLLSSPVAIVLYFVLPTVVTLLVNSVDQLAWVRDWLDLTTTSMPMYEGTLEGQGWLQVGTSVAVWGLLPMVLGWMRVLRTEVG
jgi:hypothetical protein